MSIGKTINAIGEYSFYSTDYRLFCNAISEFFKVNIAISFFTNFNEEETEYNKEDEFFDFGKTETYQLNVEYYALNSNKVSKDNIYCEYELTVPVDFEYDKFLLLEFYSTGIFQLTFLPLSNTWQFFIEDLLGKNDHYYKDHAQVVHNIKSIRDEYIQILQKINCNKVVVWTDAYYKTEDSIQHINDIATKLTLLDVLESLKEIDKLTLYNFADAVNQKVKIISNKNSFFDIALYDNFNDKIEIDSFLKETK